MPLRPYTIEICAGDLLHGCPSQSSMTCGSEWSFDDKSQNALSQSVIPDRMPWYGQHIWQPWFALRRRWSGRTVQIAAPIAKLQVPVDEIQSMWRVLQFWECRSAMFWKVVGPPELLAELAKIRTAVWGSPGASIYLCQHEIRGD